ncbi:hypothetical protein SAMN05421766_101578 [Zobellia uliginosa]|uniref:Uncharacterized protein n=1 Tax=Zobellia uliginosa TaxID=143224 RepID=A0ABY1KJ23_9FLAO|nr:hypothetical protein SAMN05421766_101578 [Zobellia uliginosa]
MPSLQKSLNAKMGLDPKMELKASDNGTVGVSSIGPNYE